MAISRCLPADVPPPNRENGLFDIWGMAAAVSKTVQEQTEGFVKTVQATDWGNELNKFTKTVSDDTQEMTREASQFMENLPETAEHLPDQVILLHAPCTASQHTAHGWCVRASQAAAVHVTSTLTQLGKTLFSSTKAFYDEVGIVC